VHYSLNGRQKKQALGDVRVLDREAALKAAKDLLAKVQLNKLDPQEAKRKAREAAQVTFESVVPMFLAAKLKGKTRRRQKIRSGTYTSYKRYLERYYFEELHKQPLNEITREQISAVLDKIEEQSGNETAYSCHSLLKDLFNWVIDEELISDLHRNPVAKVQATVKNSPRDRVLEDDEIRRIWKVCDDWEAETLELRNKGLTRSPGGYVVLPDYPRATKLLFLTGLRLQEIGDLHWSEVDLDNGELHIIKQRTKNKRDLYVPLSDTAIEILRKIKSEALRPKDPCVFGRGDEEVLTLDGGLKWKHGLDLRDTRNKIMKRFERGPIGFWKHVIDPAVKKRIEYLLAAKISTNRIMKEERISWRTLQQIKAELKAEPIQEVQTIPEMSHWRMHDIRRTVRTGWASCGVRHDIAERLIGHHVPGTTKTSDTYDRYEYWTEKVDAVTKWHDRLLSIIDGTAKAIPRSKFGHKLAAA
jgi:integrase